MKRIISFAFIAVFLVACNSDKKDEPAAAKSDAKADGAKPPVELIMDSNFINSAKASMAAFENKDIEGYTANMDDNVKFRWCSGDSLTGKQAVKDYYSGRFNIIDHIKFSNPIFLPIMANESPNGVTSAGKWMLNWYMVSVKYKNGKELHFWVHNANHFNAAGKIDEAAQYIDKQPIMEATKDLVKK